MLVIDRRRMNGKGHLLLIALGASEPFNDIHQQSVPSSHIGERLRDRLSRVTTLTFQQNGELAEFIGKLFLL